MQLHCLLVKAMFLDITFHISAFSFIVLFHNCFTINI